MFLDELVMDIIYIATPYPNHLDVDDIPCPKCFLNLLLSNSEEQSLKFYLTWYLLGHPLGLSMISTPSMAHRVLLVVLASLPN
jgi:hypothetical protein